MKNFSKLFILYFIGLLLISFETNAQNSIQYSGRVAPKDQNWVQFDWSAVRIDYDWQGSSIAAIFQDVGNMYDVFVDGELELILNTTTSQTNYPLVTVPSGSHNITLIKRTEANIGVATFGGFVVDGTPIPPMSRKPQASSRKIEMIGDSITCAYGDMGKVPCHFTPQTENAFYSYGSVLSRYFEAELYLECWSGKGVVRNYGDPNVTSVNPFPIYYPRSLANVPTSQWDFQYIPDAVVINLGTNDYSTQPQPPADIFVPGYVKFIDFIQSKYVAHNPKLQMFLVCGPMIGNPCCDNVKQVVSQMGENVHYIDMQGILDYPVDYGCDGHPSVSGQQKMADAAIPTIENVMGW